VLTIRPFRSSDQRAARTLIEEGLGAHFGHVDRDANPDLVDIRSSYAQDGNAFFVAECDGAFIGTTGVVIEAGRGRLVRVTVARAHRRGGVGSALLRRAIEHARGAGVAELVVFTQPEWPDAVGFYRAHGFEPFGRDAIDVHLRRRLAHGER
jgi:GNAT superfamily N-acetyltransferase